MAEKTNWELLGIDAPLWTVLVLVRHEGRRRGGPTDIQSARDAVFYLFDSLLLRLDTRSASVRKLPSGREYHDTDAFSTCSREEEHVST